MTVDLIFLNRDLLWQVLVASAVLWIVFLLKEYFQAGLKRFWVKIPVTFLAIFSLAMLVLKPAIPFKKNSMQGAIITRGFKKSHLDSLQALNPGLKVFEYTPNRDFGADFKKFEQVFVLGQGIELYDFWRLENKSVSFLPGEFPEGVNRVHYANENTRGNDLFLKGVYRAPKKGNRLFLADPGGNELDSVVLGGKKFEEFQLSAPLNVSGNFVYALNERDPLGKLLHSDPIPVSVQERAPIEILILNAFPSFETKYLKNFLAEGKNGLMVRTQISKDRFKTENFNREKIEISGITEENLKDFDLLILDVNSLQSFSRKQKMVLESAVKNGLGVIVQADEDLKTLSNFLSMDLQMDGPTEIVLNEFPGIPVEQYPFRILDEFGAERIHTSGEKSISFYRKVGNGRMGTTLLTNTFQLLLNGNEVVYRKIWSDLVGQIARRENKVVAWEGERFTAVKNEPFHFKLRTSLTEPQVFDDQGLIPLRRDMAINDLWYGTYYPENLGWNTLFSQQDSLMRFDFFVTEDTQWNSLRNAIKLQENIGFFEPKNLGYPLSLEPDPITPFWFFLCFLLSFIFLWLEPKF